MRIITCLSRNPSHPLAQENVSMLNVIPALVRTLQHRTFQGEL